ncbi:MAG: hypothetical protein ACLFWD_07430 [Anaerolineales bacterium]
MKPVKYVFVALFLTLSLAACAGVAGVDTPAPPEPQPEPTEGGAMGRGNIFVDVTEVRVMESFPVQLSLHLEGNLPTPCHQLVYEVSGADEQGVITVEAWSEAPADQECIQVLEPFEENIPLGTAEEGSFTIMLNGEEVGSVDL